MNTHNDPTTATIPDHIVERFAAVACSLRGCTCQPDIEIHDDQLIRHAYISHDDWCPAIAPLVARDASAP